MSSEHAGPWHCTAPACRADIKSSPELSPPSMLGYPAGLRGLAGSNRDAQRQGQASGNCRAGRGSGGHKHWWGLYPNSLTWPVERTQVSGCHISTALWPPELPSEPGMDPQVGDPDAWGDIKSWTAYFYISSVFPASDSQGSDSDSVLTLLIMGGGGVLKGEPIPPSKPVSHGTQSSKALVIWSSSGRKTPYTLKALCVCPWL